VAQGIVDAFSELEVGIPVVVRLAGTNVRKGREIIQASGLPIVMADTLADAAAKAVAATRQPAPGGTTAPAPA
jgi:malate-CoA ligase subunit beta